MKSISIAFTALLANAVADEEATPSDRFAGPVAAQERWPSSVEPTKQQLENLGDPNLKDAAHKHWIGVRFIWVPTFDSPISIRAAKQGDKRTLTVVQMAGKGRYEWGAVKLTKTIEIDDKQWAKLVALCSVDGARKPSRKLEKELRDDFVEAMSGLDGSNRFLEVRDDKGYTVERIPNPIIEDPELARALKARGNLDLQPFLDVCFYLFDLSGLKGRPHY